MSQPRDFTGLRALFINCTLKRSPELSHTQGLIDISTGRVRLLALTESGRAVKDAAQAAIQRGEERWLGRLSADDRRVFLRILRQLSAADAPAD
jgi:hypothetical protein